jgi:hypothetical protein
MKIEDESFSVSRFSEHQLGLLGTELKTHKICLFLDAAEFLINKKRSRLMLTQELFKKPPRTTARAATSRIKSRNQSETFVDLQFQNVLMRNQVAVRGSSSSSYPWRSNQNDERAEACVGRAAQVDAFLSLLNNSKIPLQIHGLPTVFNLSFLPNSLVSFSTSPKLNCSASMGNLEAAIYSSHSLSFRYLSPDELRKKKLFHRRSMATFREFFTRPSLLIPFPSRTRSLNVIRIHWTGNILK